MIDQIKFNALLEQNDIFKRELKAQLKDLKELHRKVRVLESKLYDAMARLSAYEESY